MLQTQAPSVENILDAICQASHWEYWHLPLHQLARNGCRSWFCTSNVKLCNKFALVQIVRLDAVTYITPDMVIRIMIPCHILQGPGAIAHSRFVCWDVGCQCCIVGVPMSLDYPQVLSMSVSVVMWCYVIVWTWYHIASFTYQSHLRTDCKELCAISISFRWCQ